MFKITVHYMTPDTFKVDPSHYKVVEGQTLVEALAKFNLALVELQETIHDEELAELRGMNDDIPF